MASPLIRIMENSIYLVPVRHRRRPEQKPSDIPTLKGYTAGLVDTKWLRLVARRRYGQKTPP
ncbi:NinE family protein [Escherichia coli]